jgi:plastocyanin
MMGKRLSIVAAIVLLTSFGATACYDAPLTATPPPATLVPTGSATPTPTEATSTATVTATATTTGSPVAGGTIELETGDNWFNGPSVTNGGQPGQAGSVQAVAGDVQIHVKNTGAAIHDLHVTGANLDKVTQPLQPGTDATIDLGTIPPGTYDYKCDFHPTEMFGTLVVK